MMKNIYALDLPYPEVIVDSDSIHDVKCLMDSYSGQGGETTAIMQYAYQSYVMSKYGEYWHEFFEGIAIVEMHHHMMLGETICKLGSRPVIGGNRQYWNGSFVDYTTDLKKMLLMDIRGEEIAIADYRRAIKCVNNLSIVELIERIILDEEHHIELFKSALDSLDADKSCPI